MNGWTDGCADRWTDNLMPILHLAKAGATKRQLSGILKYPKQASVCTQSVLIGHAVILDNIICLRQNYQLYNKPGYRKGPCSHPPPLQICKIQVLSYIFPKIFDPFISLYAPRFQIILNPWYLKLCCMPWAAGVPEAL